jgi:hypothetical protein
MGYWQLRLLIEPLTTSYGLIEPPRQRRRMITSAEVSVWYVDRVLRLSGANSHIV